MMMMIGLMDWEFGIAVIQSLSSGRWPVVHDNADLVVKNAKKGILFADENSAKMREL